MSDRRTALASTFDTVAAVYDAVRPTYPARLFHDLATLTGIRCADEVKIS